MHFLSGTVPSPLLNVCRLVSSVALFSLIKYRQAYNDPMNIRTKVAGPFGFLIETSATLTTKRK